MKKAYVKPDIVFESFSLSTNIAGDCDVRIDNHAENSCAYKFTGFGNVFLASISNICDGLQIDDSNGSEEAFYDGTCYHVPTQNKDLFNS